MKSYLFLQLPFLIIFLAALAGCGVQEVSPQPASGTAPVTMSITSPVFEADQPIPDRFTCQGEDVAPPLEWSAPPTGTQSLALVMDDPDAPGGTWVHWVVYNLPADVRGLPEAAGDLSALPAGAKMANNSWRRADYGGPCPPSGQHHYFFRLYALDARLDLQAADKAALLEAIDGHILGQGELVGTYQK